MLTKGDLDRLLLFRPRPGERVLSVYLHAVPSRPGGVKGRLQEAFRAGTRGLGRGRDEQERALLAEEVLTLWRELLGREATAAGLAAFSSGGGRFQWVRSLPVPFADEARWEREPYLRPLLEACDEYERLEVVLADRERARFFTCFLGELEELPAGRMPGRTRKRKASGRDRALSQMKGQHTADKRLKAHLKAVAARVAQVRRLGQVDRLVLAGPGVVPAELARQMDEDLRRRVVGTVALPVTAGSDEVLAAALRAEMAAERASEMRLAERLFSEAGQGGRAVLGLRPALSALRRRRVALLAYAEGFGARGSRCVACGALYPVKRRPCVFCGAPLEPVEDLLEAAVERAVRDGGKIACLRGEAGARLAAAGGIGALLRY